jgi:hypothetical protein
MVILNLEWESSGAGAPAFVRACGPPSSRLAGPTDPLMFFSNLTPPDEPTAKGWVGLGYLTDLRINLPNTQNTGSFTIVIFS